MSWIEDVKYELHKLDASTKSLRKFGFTIGIVILLISVWLFYKNISNTVIIIIAIIALCLIVLGAFSPKSLSRVYYYWMGFAFIAGWFVSRLLLTILFIFVLTPVAIFAKVFNKDFLDLIQKKDRSTYWKKKDYKFSNYEKMY